MTMTENDSNKHTRIYQKGKFILIKEIIMFYVIRINFIENIYLIRKMNLVLYRRVKKKANISIAIFKY